MYNDNDVTSDLVKQQVENELKARGIIGDEDQRKAEPVKLNLGGQEYTFSSQEEMQATLNNAFASVAQNQAVLLQQLEEATQKQGGGQSNDPASPQFDKDKFVKLISENPIAAFDYVDEMRYGPAKVAPAIQQELSRLQNVEATMTAYRFTQSHPEFENTNDNAAKLRAIAQNLKLGMDYESLEAAYTVGKSYGVFGQPQQQQNTQPDTGSRFGQQSQQFTAPPQINRGGNSFQDNDVEAYVNTLTDAQLRQIMEQGI